MLEDLDGVVDALNHVVLVCVEGVDDASPNRCVKIEQEQQPGADRLLPRPESADDADDRWQGVGIDSDLDSPTEPSESAVDGAPPRLLVTLVLRPSCFAVVNRQALHKKATLRSVQTGLGWQSAYLAAAASVGGGFDSLAETTASATTSFSSVATAGSGNCTAQQEVEVNGGEYRFSASQPAPELQPQTEPGPGPEAAKLEAGQPEPQMQPKAAQPQPQVQPQAARRLGNAEEEPTPEALQLCSGVVTEVGEGGADAQTCPPTPKSPHLEVIDTPITVPLANPLLHPISIPCPEYALVDEAIGGTEPPQSSVPACEVAQLVARQRAVAIPVTAILFTQGINEQQTLAHKTERKSARLQVHSISKCPR